MRILIAPVTGENPYQQQLADALRRRGHRVDSLPMTVDLPLLGGQYQIIHLHWLHPFYRGGYGLTRWLRALRFLLTLHLLKLRRTPLVWTVHNLEAHETQSPRLDALLNRQVARIAHGVVAHCEWAASELRKRYPGLPPQRIHVIPHGNYIDAYDSVAGGLAAGFSPGIHPDATVFLFFGYIRGYKGVRELLAAFRKLGHDAKAALVIAGKVQDRATQVELETAQSRDPRIHLHLDYIPPDDVAGLIALADFQVLPYRRILTSGAALLGMSLGKALIAPRIGCIPELLDRQGAELYAPDEPDGLAKALHAALRRKHDAVTMGQHNRRKAETLGWDGIAALTERCYLDQTATG